MSIIIGNINTFGTKDIVMPIIPSGESISWVDDFARITFTDNSGGLAKHEVYESLDGISFTLVTILAEGITTYDNYTWQGTQMYFRICSILRGVRSNYISLSLKTPFVVKTDQNPNTTVLIYRCWIEAAHAGASLTFDWGDGSPTETELAGVHTTNRSHTYTVVKDPYYIKISGDTEFLSSCSFRDATIYGDLSKWYLSSINELHSIESYAVGGITVAPTPTEWTYSYAFVIQKLTNLPYVGDLARINYFSLYYGPSPATSTAQIDALLTDLHTAWISHVPIYDCDYDFRGCGDPTGGALNADIVAIKAIYTAAGKTATFTVGW